MLFSYTVCTWFAIAIAKLLLLTSFVVRTVLCMVLMIIVHSVWDVHRAWCITSLLSHTRDNCARLIVVDFFKIMYMRMNSQIIFTIRLLEFQMIDSSARDS